MPLKKDDKDHPTPAGIQTRSKTRLKLLEQEQKRRSRTPNPANRAARFPGLHTSLSTRSKSLDNGHLHTISPKKLTFSPESPLTTPIQGQKDKTNSPAKRSQTNVSQTLDALHNELPQQKSTDTRSLNKRLNQLSQLIPVTKASNSPVPSTHYINVHEDTTSPTLTDISSISEFGTNDIFQDKNLQVPESTSAKPTRTTTSGNENSNCQRKQPQEGSRLKTDHSVTFADSSEVHDQITSIQPKSNSSLEIIDHNQQRYSHTLTNKDETDTTLSEESLFSLRKDSSDSDDDHKSPSHDLRSTYTNLSRPFVLQGGTWNHQLFNESLTGNSTVIKAPSHQYNSPLETWGQCAGKDLMSEDILQYSSHQKTKHSDLDLNTLHSSLHSVLDLNSRPKGQYGYHHINTDRITIKEETSANRLKPSTERFQQQSSETIKKEFVPRSCTSTMRSPPPSRKPSGSPDSTDTEEDPENTSSYLDTFQLHPIQKVSLPNSVSPDSFSGTDKEDARIWWANFCKYAILKGWNDQVTLATIPLFFKNAASIWFDSLEVEKKQTLKKLHKAFAKRYFLDESLKWVWLDKFNSRTQKEDEKSSDYAQEMVKLGRDLKKNDKETMEGMVRGLKSRIRNYVMEHDPKTLDEALHHAKMAEAFRGETTKTDEGIAELTKQMAALKAQITNELGAIKVATVATKYNGPGPAKSTWSNTPPRPRFNDRPQSYNGPKNRQYDARPGWGSKPRVHFQQPYGRRFAPCRSCGETTHDRSDCRYKNYQCKHCKRVGHLQKVCQSRIVQQTPK